MRSYVWLALLAPAALAAAIAACGDDDDDNGADGRAAAGGRGGRGGAAGAPAAGAAGAPAETCGGFVTDADDACQACVRDNCCDAAATCLAQGDACAACDRDPYGEACQQNTDSFAFRKCRLGRCAEACQIPDAKVDVDAPARTNETSCGEDFACNPVKPEKCTGANPEFCDANAKVGVCDETGQVGQPGLGYACYCPPQKRSLGQSCNATDGFCLEGLDCYNWTDTCAKYCCDDDDCGPDARCAKEPGALWGKGKVGVCLVRDAF